MKFTIGQHQPPARTVQVQFVHAGVVFERPVNACFDEAGQFDAWATEARVEDVALGVAYKIEMGVIANAPAVPEISETQES